ncbi:Retinal pigment epithelial membrane protein [Synechococcus sp. PCC 7335]|uniref:carotenoid oxygenase family protein n=1 Tax=Synechococcus sp. (strain ATCC 29403 / PCC 7335) TaxID=91464 RepID=UPI00017EC768|nr:carotenoid oxygenase family protein [Synechococcus sp. PCC 7335]EDX86898.1 Retinal pigment epithelial membrane protein [Synechococcus sp. PCC 7335]
MASSLTSSLSSVDTASNALGNKIASDNEPQPWHGAFAEPAKEFPPTDLAVLSGDIPEDLQGTFYQNGTGRLERGGQPVGHWFDGDGAVLRVKLSPAGAKATYRYVQTQGYKAESEAGRFLFGNYGMRSPGPLWKHMLGLFNGTAIKNSANTSVFALEDKLLALWEAGNPHSLDLETLETIGLESLGWLKTAQPFSAHPLRDPISGEIYSIGVDSLCELSIYRCDASGGLVKKRAIALKEIPLVHSFVIAGPYLIFLVSPVKVNPLPLLLNKLAYADAVKWAPDLGTRTIVVDRESLETVSDSYTDSWFQWHYGNGCLEADGSIRLDYARFDDFAHINEVLREVPSGRMKTKAYGRLWQLKLEPKSGRILSNDCVVDQDCEFPQVPSNQVGLPWEQTYVLMHREGVKTGEDWFGAVGRFDYTTQQLTQTDLGDGVYGSEPLHVVGRQTAKTSEGWLLIVVYNSLNSRSELWIFAAKTLGEPVCRVALPSVVPIGFHGTWQAS